MTNVAVFRPDDGRLDDAIEYLQERGVTPIPDAMLEVEATGGTAREDAEYTVFTSRTGAELVADTGWSAGDTGVCAIGDTTRDALENHGYAVDIVPDEFSSMGLVAALGPMVDGATVEVARSDHGSQRLLDGLNDAGAYVHETVLYRLVRPDDSGESTEYAARGDLQGALFTSSLTVEHFLAAAHARGRRAEAIAGLNDAVVGCIGTPTAQTAEANGIEVDVVPETADFQALADAALSEL